MNAHTPERPDYGFVIGLLAGAFVGAGLVMWLGPRSASHLGDSARSLGERASARYRQASARVGEVVEDLTRRGQDVLDHAAEAVARVANEVESPASAARRDRVTEAKPHSAADRSASKPHSL